MKGTTNQVVKEPYRVVIVEDDNCLRQRFAEAVNSSSGLVLVGEASDLPEGFRTLAEVSPDLLLVDIGLPSGCGIELIRYVYEKHPACDVMVVTVFADEQHVLQCIEAGATGYLLKDASAMDIVKQIGALRAGGSPISPRIARQLLKRFQPEVKSDMTFELSRQEQTVLTLSTKGYRYEEIAGMLDISRHTVETYVKRIYRKLQVHSKTEAVYEARKLGLVRD
jgi:DNA-binding NarL/FixJ family response regulator